jgi:hypothetical protein
MRHTGIALIASLGLAAAAIPQERRVTIPAGTIIRVRTTEPIAASRAAPGRVFPGIVAEDATDKHGIVIIPKDALAELAVRGVSRHELALGLASIRVAGKRFSVSASQEIIGDAQKPGVGKNNRMVGGFLEGGAGAQTLTRGKSVHVPAESVLTFRLERPLTR